mmetsp:Transcript_12464/g.23289  ORF Transcript_12464/g.23289 Transcript_12464/m.23289 type:complete len:295 (-) Transcript_12464:416-1300(-)
MVEPARATQVLNSQFWDLEVDSNEALLHGKRVPFACKDVSGWETVAVNIMLGSQALKVLFKAAMDKESNILEFLQDHPQKIVMVIFVQGRQILFAFQLEDHSDGSIVILQEVDLGELCLEDILRTILERNLLGLGKQAKLLGSMLCLFDCCLLVLHSLQLSFSHIHLLVSKRLCNVQKFKKLPDRASSPTDDRIHGSLDFHSASIKLFNHMANHLFGTVERMIWIQCCHPHGRTIASTELTDGGLGSHHVGIHEGADIKSTHSAWNRTGEARVGCGTGVGKGGKGVSRIWIGHC